jgi:hypothetical protein
MYVIPVSRGEQYGDIAYDQYTESRKEKGICVDAFSEWSGCMYVYVCMHDMYMYVWYVCMCVLTSGYVCMHVCICVCMYVCMYICM